MSHSEVHSSAERPGSPAGVDLANAGMAFPANPAKVVTVAVRCGLIGRGCAVPADG